MVFQALPNSGPLSVAGQQSSDLLEFFVPGEVEKAFIRVIALFRDNEPLGPAVDEAPTFRIRAAGGGLFTSVRPDSGEVTIPNAEFKPVGSLQCQREPKDIFLITIAAPEDRVFSDVVDHTKPWILRIQNNAPDLLRFLGFSSHKEPDTRQPWMRLGDPNTSFISSHLEFVGKATLPIEVRNWGTKPLTFDEGQTGPIGGRDSGLVLRTLPGKVDPHQVDVIIFESTQDDTRTEIQHQFRCDDTIEAHAKVSLEIKPPQPPQPPPPPPSEFFCREGCGCDDFLGSPTDSVCGRGICRHSRVRHLPI